MIEDQKARAVDLDNLAERSEETQPRSGRPSVAALDDIIRWAIDPGYDPRPLYALLGETGMGKTRTCQRAYLHLQDRRNDGEAVPVPWYFDLRKVQLRRLPCGVDVPTLREAVDDCLKHGRLHEGGEPPRYQDLFDDIDRGAVVFFDGLDDVLSRLFAGQGLAFTANLLKILPEARQRKAPELRVLVSCRTQFFRNLREQKAHFTGDHRGATGTQMYRAMIMLPFDDAQIRKYLAAVQPGSDPEALQTWRAPYEPLSSELLLAYALRAWDKGRI